MKLPATNASTHAKRVGDFFKKQVSTYDEVPWQKDTAFYAWIAAHLGDTREHTIVELGCATGNLLLHLAPLSKIVVGIDSSPQMCELARGKAVEAQLPNIEVHTLDATKMMGIPSQSADLVIARNAFHHMTGHKKAVSEAKRILKKNGRMVIIESTAPPHASDIWRKIYSWKDIGRTFYFTHEQLRIYFECIWGEKSTKCDAFISHANDIELWVTKSSRPTATAKKIIGCCTKLSPITQNHIGVWQQNGRWVIDKQFSYIEFHV